MVGHRYGIATVAGTGAVPFYAKPLNVLMLAKRRRWASMRIA
jgi:hypothetical protein